jgi:hypothetical protein
MDFHFTVDKRSPIYSFLPSMFHIMHDSFVFLFLCWYSVVFKGTTLLDTRSYETNEEEYYQVRAYEYSITLRSEKKMSSKW